MDKRDLEKGLLETLGNLSKVSEVPKERALQIWLAHMIAGNKVLVMVEAGQVIGTATLTFDWKYAHGGVLIARLEDVATHPSWEHQKVATRLIDHLIIEAQAEGKRIGLPCLRIDLSCPEERTGFYQKFGFCKHEVAMRLDLRPDQ